MGISLNSSRVGFIVATIGVVSLILSAHFTGIGGCGAATRGASGEVGSTGAGATNSSISTVASNIQSSVSAVVTSTTNQQGLKAVASEEDDCDFTENEGGGGFTITCSCEGGGTSVMNITGTPTEGTCGSGEGGTFLMDGDMTISFNDCQTTTSCGNEEHVSVMVGTLTGSIHVEYNFCEDIDILETTVSSTGGVESCDGIAVAVDPDATDEQTINIGMSVTITGSTGDHPGECDTDGDENVGGDAEKTVSICVNGTTYASLEEMVAALDPEGSCTSDETSLVSKSVDTSTDACGDESSDCTEDMECSSLVDNEIQDITSCNESTGLCEIDCSARTDVDGCTTNVATPGSGVECDDGLCTFSLDPAG